jgi:hypothetical protein
LVEVSHGRAGFVFSFCSFVFSFFGTNRSVQFSEAAAAAVRDGWKDDIILALTAELAARTAELVVRKRRRTSS